LRQPDAVGIRPFATQRRESIARLLEDDQVAQSLEELVGKLPELNAVLDIMRQFVTSSSRLADNANDIIRTAKDGFGNGKSLADRVGELQTAAEQGGKLAGQLGGPVTNDETIESLKSLIGMLPDLVATLKIVEQFLANSTRFAENLNAIVQTARDAKPGSFLEGLDREVLLDLPTKALELVKSPVLGRLLESRVLSVDALDVMDGIADATIAAHTNTSTNDLRVSRLGAFKALGDEDVQRGLALAIELARNIGKQARGAPL
ncbi:MAG: DUF1641 domain-containing protein, partial [Planctomycetota bacterium]